MADINSTGVENRTALHYAVYENRLDSTKLLIAHGALIDARTIHQRTPLHIACILGEEEMCQFLLDKGAAINLQDFDLNTPTHYAAFYSKCITNFRKFKDIKDFNKEEARLINKEQERTITHRHHQQQNDYCSLLDLSHRNQQTINEYR